MTSNSYRCLMTIVVALLLAASTSCNSQIAEDEHAHERDPAKLEAISLDPGQKLRVVATTNIVGDVVANIGADLIDLSVLMAVGVDPHTYVPTPADAVLIHDAHVIFFNGAGLEADLDEMLDNAGGDAVSVVLSDGLKLRALSAPDGYEENDGEEEHHEHEDLDPHVWFSVPNVQHWVETIEHSLAILDPSNASGFERNAEAYSTRLDELDAWIRQQINQIPGSQRKLVTNHPSFGYLADRYGLEQVGAMYPISPSSEPSAQDIAALEDAIREYDVPAVFAESTVNPSLAEQVARDVGIRLVPLHTGSLSGTGEGAETYIELMRYDVQAIVDALR